MSLTNVEGFENFVEDGAHLNLSVGLVWNIKNVSSHTVSSPAGLCDEGSNVPTTF